MYTVPLNLYVTVCTNQRKIFIIVFFFILFLKISTCINCIENYHCKTFANIQQVLANFIAIELQRASLSRLSTKCRFPDQVNTEIPESISGTLSVEGKKTT